MKKLATLTTIKTKTKRLKKPGLAAARRLADTPLPEITFLTSFVLSRWWLNSDFSYPSEVVQPILLMAVLASLAFYIYRFVLGRGLATHVAAIVLSYVFYSYRFIHDHGTVKRIWGTIPERYSTEFTQSLAVLVAAVVVCGAVGWLAGATQRYRYIRAFQPYKILLFAILFMFAVQAVRFGERYYEIKEELAYKYASPLVDIQPKKASKSKPDIYYLIFDRYGSAEALKDSLKFDNSELIAHLASEGFVTREPAYANYPFTMSSVSSTVAMSYFPDFEKKFGGNGVWQAAFPYRDIFNNPPIAQILQKNGYSYNQLSSWWDFSRVGINADTEPTKAFRLRAFGANYYFSDLQRDIIYKSLFSPWLKKGLTIGDTTVVKYDLDYHPRDNFYAQMDAIKTIAGRADKSVPQFSVAHVLVPHPPYVFDAEGRYPTYDGESTDNGIDEVVKYTNQVTFVNHHIKEVASEIRRKSPDAVIIIQADEGPYPKEFRFELSPDHYYNPLDLKPQKMRQKFSILASYRLPGADQTAARRLDSSVNTFRFVLNQYLGYDLPMLPECNLSIGNKFNIFNYELVNETLTGQPAPDECKQYE